MDTERDIYHKAKKITEQILDVMFMQSEKEDHIDLQQWMDENTSSAETIELLSDPELLKNRLQPFCHPEKYKKAQTLMIKLRKRRLRKRIIRYSGVAACLILGGLLILQMERRGNELQLQQIEQSGPTLILANGECLDLTAINPERKISDGDHIRSVNRNELTYITEDTQTAIAEKEYNNKLIIPQLCTYRVVLSDSSIVHLNAVSELTYPEKFLGNERHVTLSGEAYFEVRHSSRPFIVHVGNARVKVYGTKFNINAYSANRIETVLIEGKVGVALQQNPAGEKILKPSQLNQLNPQTGEQQVTNIRIEKYISWISGTLRYEDDPLREVIEDLERWYGLSLTVADPYILTTRVTASINKDLPFTDIILMLTNNLNVEFRKKEGGFLIIQK